MANPKARTSININRNVLADIRSSGVRNLSKYFEDLAKADLYNISKLSGQEKETIDKLNKELEYWAKEWEALEKRKVTK